MAEQIPFNRPRAVGDEYEYMRRAVDGGHTATGGPFAKRATDLLREAHGSADVLLTTSCTDALEMTAMLLDVGPDDTVICPSFTFTSTALAYARAGATLRFADIEPVTLGTDPASVAGLLDDSVKAVATVNYAGVACDLDGILDVLPEQVPLVEDNAHGLFGTHRGRPLGTFGRLSTLSFHETKNFYCGEGGALVINDERDVERAHVLYDKGTNRRSFMLGQVDKYSWQDTGSSFGMSDLTAAFLLAQLERAESVLATRQALSDRYRQLLAPHADRLGLTLPALPDTAVSANHMFYVLLPTAEIREPVLGRLNAAGVHATFHYVPLHSSPAGRRFTDEYRECPVTDDISSRLIRLPFFNGLAISESERVVEALVEALGPGG